MLGVGAVPQHPCPGQNTVYKAVHIRSDIRIATDYGTLTIMRSPHTPVRLAARRGSPTSTGAYSATVKLGAIDILE